MYSGSMQWAREEFGTAKLGDVRNSRRLVVVAAGAAKRPSGTVSAVFDRPADREGAYDFLENDKIKPHALVDAMGSAAAKRAAGHAFAFVAIDSSAVAITDKSREKGLGPVGPLNTVVRGLMVMNALAVSPEGVPLGLVEQRYWNRAPTQKLTPAERTKRDQERAFEEKESSEFLEAAKSAHARLAAQNVRAWVVIDRAGDARDILQGLHGLGCLFTVRASWNRVLSEPEGSKLQDSLDAAPSLGTYDIEIGRSGRRAARAATIEVRATPVTLHFRSRPLQDEATLALYAVRLRETGERADRIEWTLYTNVPVTSAERAQEVIESYRTRWRVEEFHRTWKKGDCNVEDAQLGSIEALKRWAIILAAVAARIERLKYLARKKPDTPASVELSAEEIEALTLGRRARRGTRRSPAKPVPAAPSIGEAVAWIAELGGWIGLRNGQPGSSTLARGLERLGYMVEGIALAKQHPHLHRRGTRVQ